MVGIVEISADSEAVADHIYGKHLHINAYAFLFSVVCDPLRAVCRTSDILVESAWPCHILVKQFLDPGSGAERTSSTSVC